jgi:hypothetical protein
MGVPEGTYGVFLKPSPRNQKTCKINYVEPKVGKASWPGGCNGNNSMPGMVRGRKTVSFS